MGECPVDHGLIDEQLTVYYSTNGGSTWKQAEYLVRGSLLSYQAYGTRTIDLSNVTACNNNPNFALRFRWQLNTASDAADLDNIIVAQAATFSLMNRGCSISSGTGCPSATRDSM